MWVDVFGCFLEQKRQMIKAGDIGKKGFNRLNQPCGQATAGISRNASLGGPADCSTKWLLQSGSGSETVYSPRFGQTRFHTVQVDPPTRCSVTTGLCSLLKGAFCVFFPQRSGGAVQDSSCPGRQEALRAMAWPTSRALKAPKIRSYERAHWQAALYTNAVHPMTRKAWAVRAPAQNTDPLLAHEAMLCGCANSC